MAGTNSRWKRLSVQKGKQLSNNPILFVGSHGQLQRRGIVDMSKERVVWVDALKGFAILCVVVGHIADGYLNAGIFPAEKTILRGIYDVIFMFHMALFFFLSGYTFSFAYRGDEASYTWKSQRFRSQLFNLGILYVIYSILMGVMKIVAADNINNPVTGKDLLMIWCKSIPPYWYLYVLIIYYLVFFRMKILDRENILLAVFAVTGILGCIINLNGWFEVNRTLKFALPFYIGILCNERKEHWLFKGPSVIASSVLSAFLIFFRLGNSTLNISLPWLKVFTPIGIILLFFRLSAAVQKTGLFSCLGKYSLEIYLLHCFLTAGNRVLLPALGIKAFWPSVLCNLVISTSVPILFACFTKKVKGLETVFQACGSLYQKFPILTICHQ